MMFRNNRISNATEDVNVEISNKIDQLKYTDFVEYKEKPDKISDKITIDWKEILSKPPVNTSEETVKELRYLSQLTDSLTPSQRVLVDLVDSEPLDLFRPIVKRYGLHLDQDVFDEIWNITEPVVMSLKNMYNRPRPNQLAGVYGLKINVVESETYHTPAYPSGHTVYTAMGALLLDSLYPEFSDQFFQQIGMAGYARILQGVHYPSDNRSAIVIANAIWEDIRNNFV